jgi:hypothetical protein
VFEYLATDLKKYMDRNGRGPSNPLPKQIVKVKNRSSYLLKSWPGCSKTVVNILLKSLVLMEEPRSSVFNWSPYRASSTRC